MDLSSETRATATIELAIRCVDLTSLEGSETPERVIALCDRAVRPDPADHAVPSVAALVLYPAMVSVAAKRLRSSSVKVAAVAGFPQPEAPLNERLEEIRGAVEAGAGEVDVVLRRDLVLSDRADDAAAEIARSKEAAAPAMLKVILETGELGSDQRIRKAAMVAMHGGADFIKSSTGKVGPGVTPEAARTMMEAVRDFHGETGRAVGVKISGGVRTADQALSYIELLNVTLGSGWLTPERFRIGASSLLDDLVRRLRAGRGTG